MQPTSASTLVILGAGGHGRVVADAALAAGWARVVATDRRPSTWGQDLLPGVPVLPLDQALALDARVHVAIGSAEHREEECVPLAARLATVIHPQATVSKFARLDAGCFVAAQAVVGPSAALGTGVIVNHGAVVDHEVQVGAFSHVAPLASLGGQSRVGSGVLVGAGARLLPQVALADGCVIGAGAVVRHSIHEAGVYAGVPVRRVR